MARVFYIDGVFTSKWLSKFINQVFFTGKQQKIEVLLYKSFYLIKKRLKLSPFLFFFEALEKIKPLFGLKLHMKRTNTLLIGFPYVLGLSSRYKKALAWLSMSIKLKTKKTFTFKIFQEIYDIIFFGSGSSIKKKSEFYSAAISIKRNKMFRW